MIPNGKRLKLNLTNAAMNVVNSVDSLASGICQNPEFASSLVKTRACAYCASVCCTVGLVVDDFRDTHSDSAV